MNNRNLQEEAQIELILAASIGNLDGAIRALKNGADVDALLPDTNIQLREPYRLSEADRKSSALQIAVTYGHVDMVKLLLNHEANPNLLCNGKSPFITAVEAQNIDIASLLLEHKADVNQLDSERKSAYEISALNNNDELCSLLLNHGAKRITLEQHIRKEIRDSLYPSLHYANIDTLDAICNFLIANFPRHSALIYSELTRDNILRKCFLATKDTSRCRALLRLIDLFEESSQPFDTAALLPEKYTFANLNLKEDIFASIQKLPLQERIKKYNAILNRPDSSYYRIFHMKRGYIWGVSEKRGILHDIREAYYNDMTLNKRLLTATKDNDLKAMQACIKQGADVNYCDVNIPCNYALHIAAAYGYVDAARLLLDNGADINVILSHENPLSRVTPLYSSITQDHPEMVELLLGRHADANIAVEYDQCTPLMNAASKGDVRMVIALLTHDAKIDTFGNEHLSFASPLTYPLRDGQHEILGLMVDHMIKYYDIERIVKFLQSHDNLKNCFKQAGENQKLLAPLHRLLTHLVLHNVDGKVYEEFLPEYIRTPAKQVVAAPEAATTPLYPKLAPENTETSEKQTASASLYPQIKQESVQHSDIMQQYLNARQLRAEAAQPKYVVENPFTDAPLPQASVAPVSDPFAAIDTILQAPAAPKQPSWIEGLNEIDFSGSSTAVMMSKLADLISFEEPAKPCATPFDDWIETPAKTGYRNPFDELLEHEEEDAVAAQLAGLPKAPTGGVFFAVKTKSKSNAEGSSQKRVAVPN